MGRYCVWSRASASPTRRICAAGWRTQRLRVTQATLSRDLQELKLIKTTEGYKTGSALPDESTSVAPLTRALREFLLDIRPAENLLVLKTPPSGAQPLAAAVDAAKFPEIAGTIAGDDTVLIITTQSQDAGLSAEKDRSTREMRDSRQIAVVGVTGYTGFELATLLLRHPGIVSQPFMSARATGPVAFRRCFPSCAGGARHR